MREPGSRGPQHSQEPWPVSDDEYQPAITQVGPRRDVRTGTPARFIGGSLDGQTINGVCARWYTHAAYEAPLVRTVYTVFEPPTVHKERYERSATVYADGANYANDSNQGKLSHLEYTLCSP